MIAKARWGAYVVLRAVNQEHADLSHALETTRLKLSDERDRALVTEIATGTLRWLSKLDYLISHYSSRPSNRLDPDVLDILRMSTYQLIHLNRVPASAIVNDAVSLTRRIGKTSAGGLVNATLRSISRSNQCLPLPQPPKLFSDGNSVTSNKHLTPDSRKSALDFLNITLSHPRWLVERWFDRYGFEIAVNWARFNNTPAPLTLRTNRLKTPTNNLVEALAEYQVDVRPTRYAPDGLSTTRGNPLATPLANSGLFIVQDEASQLVAELAKVQPGECVLDACAAPGGKTTALAAMMNNLGMLIATDLRKKRINLLRQTVERCQATCVRIVQTDLIKTLPFRQSFDCVLVDAPCTGLGTIRRDPEIRWRRTETDLKRMSRIQLDMLNQASKVVRLSGRLIYATCSSEPEENEQVVDSFLASHPNFRPLNPKNCSGGIPDSLKTVLNEQGRLRTTPDAHGLENFFGALIERISED